MEGSGAVGYGIPVEKDPIRRSGEFSETSRTMTSIADVNSNLIPFRKREVIGRIPSDKPRRNFIQYPTPIRARACLVSRGMGIYIDVGRFLRSDAHPRAKWSATNSAHPWRQDKPSRGELEDTLVQLEEGAYHLHVSRRIRA